MTESLSRLLLRLSEAGEPAILWGRQAASYSGREFERLLGRGVLVEEAPATQWDVCSICECGLEERPVEQIGGRLIAVCPLDRSVDVALDVEDLRSFRIDPFSLVRQIAAASGFEGEPAQAAPGVWRLGLSATNRATFLALSTHAVLQPGLLGALRQLNRASALTLIAPRLPPAEQARFAEADIFLVLARQCFTETAGFALDLSKLEPPRKTAPRLVIRRADKFVALDGVEKRLPDQPFRLLVLLAEHALQTTAALDNREIEKQLWGSNIHLIASQVREPVRDLRNALAAGSARPEEIRALIQNRRSPNGYRLALAPEDIQLIP